MGWSLFLSYPSVVIFWEFYWCKHDFDNVSVCIYMCTHNLLTFCAYLLCTFFNPLFKRMVSWLPIACLYFNRLAFREKNLGCPMDFCTTFILVHILARPVSFKPVAIETFIIFLAFHSIVVHNVSFYSVTFSGIRW